jgi:hypothetical protein
LGDNFVNSEQSRTEPSVLDAWRDRAFAEFWDRYPRKVAKLAAQRKWNALGLTPELLGRIFAALDWYREEWLGQHGPIRPVEQRYIPHAATWLSGRRWRDGEADEYARTCEDWLERYCFHQPTCESAEVCRAKWGRD